MVDEIWQLDSCGGGGGGGGTRPLHGCLSLAARAWRSDGFLAVYLKEQVEPTHEGVDAPFGRSIVLVV